MEALLRDEKTLGALIGLFGVLAAVLVNLYWNFRNAKSARKQPFLQAQLDACMEVAAAAATIASSKTPEAETEAISTFWQLYWGQLAIVEDQSVELEMVRFGKLIKRVESGKVVPAVLLEDGSLDLSFAIRELIFKSWQIQLPVLAKAKRSNFEEDEVKAPSWLELSSARYPDN